MRRKIYSLVNKVDFLMIIATGSVCLPLREVIYNSDAARVAAALMRSRTAQLFHDHVLVKEPGTAKPTLGIRTAPIILLTGPRHSASGYQLKL